jgi:hypothetical protein
MRIIPLLCYTVADIEQTQLLCHISLVARREASPDAAHSDMQNGDCQSRSHVGMLTPRLVKGNLVLIMPSAFISTAQIFEHQAVAV